MGVSLGPDGSGKSGRAPDSPKGVPFYCGPSFEAVDKR